MPAQTPSKLSVNFSDVEDRREGGKSVHVPPGDYLLQIVGCELRSKKDDETSKYLSWKMKIVKPTGYENKGFIYHVTSLSQAALWNLRNLLEDIGITVPKKSVDIPIAKIVASKPIIGATIDDDEYEGKTKSKIQNTFKKADYEDTGSPASEDEETETSSDDEDLEELDTDDL